MLSHDDREAKTGKYAALALQCLESAFKQDELSVSTHCKHAWLDIGSRFGATASQYCHFPLMLTRKSYDEEFANASKKMFESEFERQQANRIIFQFPGIYKMISESTAKATVDELSAEVGRWKDEHPFKEQVMIHLRLLLANVESDRHIHISIKDAEKPRNYQFSLDTYEDVLNQIVASAYDGKIGKSVVHYPLSTSCIKFPSCDLPF